MADLNQSPSPVGRAGKVRSKKYSTRIDMTPMVDLAFLLLTFFVLTAALIKPFIMRIDIPEDSDTDPPPININRTMTVVLKEKNKIFWYAGEKPQVRLTSFSQKGIRKVLQEMNAQIKGLYVFIKPSDQSRYSNLVDILDEMTISEIKRYAIVDITAQDEELIKRSTQ